MRLVNGILLAFAPGAVAGFPRSEPALREAVITLPAIILLFGWPLHSR